MPPFNCVQLPLVVSLSKHLQCSSCVPCFVHAFNHMQVFWSAPRSMHSSTLMFASLQRPAKYPTATNSCLQPSLVWTSYAVSHLSSRQLPFKDNFILIGSIMHVRIACCRHCDMLPGLQHAAVQWGSPNSGSGPAGTVWPGIPALDLLPSFPLCGKRDTLLLLLPCSF